MITQKITLTEKGLNAGPLYDVYYSTDCTNFILTQSEVSLPNVGSTANVQVADNTVCVKLINLSPECTLNEVVIDYRVTTTTTAGEYSGPQELGLRKWKKSELGAFDIESDSPANNISKNKTTRKNVYKVVGGWEPQQGKFEVPTYDVDGEREKVITKGQLLNDPIEWYKPFKNNFKTKKEKIKIKKMNEDLAVWFGKNKKPKGSSQPKGPWVDICRRVDGKHPPCGRKDADSGSYPKCRAAGVAGKMSDSQKRAACQQKRKAEKNDPQRGKGQKPVMTSYKTKKESINKLVDRVLLEIRKFF